jgi:hypothetical protein
MYIIHKVLSPLWTNFGSVDGVAGNINKPNKRDACLVDIVGHNHNTSSTDDDYNDHSEDHNVKAVSRRTTAPVVAQPTTRLKVVQVPAQAGSRQN